MDRKDLLEKIVSYYGKNHQKNKAMEEMGELISELSREQDDRTSLPKIQEEIADVWIMMFQLSIIYGAEDVNKIIDFKLNRQNQRINGGNIDR